MAFEESLCAFGQFVIVQVHYESIVPIFFVNDWLWTLQIEIHFHQHNVHCHIQWEQVISWAMYCFGFWWQKAIYIMLHTPYDTIHPFWKTEMKDHQKCRCKLKRRYRWFGRIRHIVKPSSSNDEHFYVFYSKDKWGKLSSIWSFASHINHCHFPFGSSHSVSVMFDLSKN